jgi:hypothetical protein
MQILMVFHFPRGLKNGPVSGAREALMKKTLCKAPSAPA